MCNYFLHQHQIYGPLKGLSNVGLTYNTELSTRRAVQKWWGDISVPLVISLCGYVSAIVSAPLLHTVSSVKSLTQGFLPALLSLSQAVDKIHHEWMFPRNVSCPTVYCTQSYSGGHREVLTKWSSVLGYSPLVFMWWRNATSCFLGHSFSYQPSL